MRVVMDKAQPGMADQVNPHEVGKSSVHEHDGANSAAGVRVAAVDEIVDGSADRHGRHQQHPKTMHRRRQRCVRIVRWQPSREQGGEMSHGVCAQSTQTRAREPGEQRTRRRASRADGKNNPESEDETECSQTEILVNLEVPVACVLFVTRFQSISPRAAATSLR